LQTSQEPGIGWSELSSSWAFMTDPNTSVIRGSLGKPEHVIKTGIGVIDCVIA
jgi:hypothetical protein